MCIQGHIDTCTALTWEADAVPLPNRDQVQQQPVDLRLINLQRCCNTATACNTNDRRTRSAPSTHQVTTYASRAAEAVTLLMLHR